MATKTPDTTKKIAANSQLRTRRVIAFTSLPSSDAPYGIGSVESVERDAGVGGRWQCHQDAGHDEEESCKQPATSTTSHNPSPPSHDSHRGADEDSSRPKYRIGRWKSQGSSGIRDLGHCGRGVTRCFSARK